MAPAWKPVGILAVALLAACGGGDGGGGSAPPLTGWAALRAAARPEVALPDEFAEPRLHGLAVDGWEDGICISRDGLHLYAVYAPADLLSFALAGNDQTQAQDFLRGPTFGMDLTTLPVGLPAPQPTVWLHGDILHASRTSRDQPFAGWSLTAMSRPVWSEGAPQPSGAGPDWSCFASTSNEHAPDYQAHVVLARNASADPASAGAMLPGPVTTNTAEDNPHIEVLGGGGLVLFFDSDNRQSGRLRDIWYATSADDGVTWTAPVTVASLNSPLEEQQPHLWKDGDGIWWLYYTGTNPADGKLGIFRAKQSVPGDWDSWTGSELVIGAGNTVAVGEPTLTADGDLSFVVIIEDVAHGTATNRYDADPWYAPRRPAAIGRLAPAARRSLAMLGSGR